jgi:hypothetical protein
VHGHRNRVGGVKRNKLRAFPIIPKIMNVMEITLPIFLAISKNMYSMQMKENDWPIYFIERKVYKEINERKTSAILINELGNGIENIDKHFEPYRAFLGDIT